MSDPVGDVVDVADALRRVDPGPRPSVHDVSAAIDEAVMIQARIDALEGVKLLVVERARQASAGCERALLDERDPELRRASSVRRHELAVRAFTADLATALRLPEQEASHLVDTARVLTDVAGDVADAGAEPALVRLCRGRFSAAHARALADTLADLPDGEARREVDAAVLPAAPHVTLPQFRRRLRRARDRAHPVPLTVRHRAATTKRAVYLDPGADGMAWLTAHLPAAQAHAIHDRLTRAARAARDGGDPRETGQLRADALAGLLLAGREGTGADRPVGGVGGDPGRVPDLVDLTRRIAPTVRVMVPVLALLGGDAGDAGDGGSRGGSDDAARGSDAGPDAVERHSGGGSRGRLAHARRPGVFGVAELDGQVPVDAETAIRLTASAPSLRRFLVDPVDGTVLTADPGTYAVPAALRSLLQVRDVTCTFPGCTRAAAACDVDHVRAWVDGGATVAENLTQLCRRHHVLKHQTGWRVARAPDGLTWTSPTGRVHRSSAGAPEPADAEAPSARGPADTPRGPVPGAVDDPPPPVDPPPPF